MPSFFTQTLKKNACTRFHRGSQDFCTVQKEADGLCQHKVRGNCCDPEKDSCEGGDPDPAGRFPEPCKRDNPEQDSTDCKKTGQDDP